MIDGLFRICGWIRYKESNRRQGASKQGGSQGRALDMSCWHCFSSDCLFFLFTSAWEWTLRYPGVLEDTCIGDIGSAFGGMEGYLHSGHVPRSFWFSLGYAHQSILISSLTCSRHPLIILLHAINYR